MAGQHREVEQQARALDARARDLLTPETNEDGEGEDDEKVTDFVRCTPAVNAKWHRARFWASRIEGHLHRARTALASRRAHRR